MEYKEFPKIARLSRECIITEKIDGTNGCIYIPELPGDIPNNLPFLVGSRTRWITPQQDNHGFAGWAYDHVEDLKLLGPGWHYGEWWGKGIQRGYGLQEKRFSLFNVTRWEEADFRPSCCDVVPTLYRGTFTTDAVEKALDWLKAYGSAAVPGYNRPEGVVVYHVAGNSLWKKTIEKDELPKGFALGGK